MKEQEEIMMILQSRLFLIQELHNLLYGNIEIRNNNKDYIYVHYREDGIPITKYVGLYTKELYEQISINNYLAKEYKASIRKMNKRLKELNYSEQELDITVKNNIDFAKRELINQIYNQAVLEGISTTLLNTENIINGGKVNNMTVEDITKIVNMKHAWEFILNKNIILCDTNYDLLCRINKFILEGFYYSAGKVRNVPVNITGTNYKPSIPIETQIKEELSEIFNKNKSIIDKAIDLLLYIMKKQIFIDGNKRTSIIFVNHYLISKGKGLIEIPYDQVEYFKKLLIDYYEGIDKVKIREFLKKNCYKKI